MLSLQAAGRPADGGHCSCENGAAVTILEQNEKPGKKICATGNGNVILPIPCRLMHTKRNPALNRKF